MNRRRLAVGLSTLVVSGLALIAWLNMERFAALEAGEAPPAVVADPSRVRFVALGDAGDDSSHLRAVATAIGQVCESRGCDFGVLLGDNKYPAGVAAADDPEMDAAWAPLEALGLPFYVTLGNHDYGDSTDETPVHAEIDWAKAHPNYILPARIFAFVAGPARFVSIDTTHAFWDGSEPQQGWAVEQLKAGDARWKVAFGHHPLRSDGWHGDVGSYDDAGAVPIASGDRLKPLLYAVCAEADLYVAGHDHILEWLDDPACKATLVVSGAGSSPRETVDRGHTPRFLKGEVGGFAWIELADTLTVAFYDEKGELLFEGAR